MSLLEAIEGLSLAAKKVEGISEGNCIHLNELRLQLPNWEKSLDELSKSYILNLPKMNHGLIGSCNRLLDILEARPAGLGTVVGGISSVGTSVFGTAGQSYLCQSDFNNTKIDFEIKARNLRDSIAAIGCMGGNDDPRVDKALGHLGELDGRVTREEAFAMGGYVFCSHT
jgi:hypothetical protein